MAQGPSALARPATNTTTTTTTEHGGIAFVRQVGVVPLGGDQGIADGALIAGGWGQAEGTDDPSRRDGQRHLEAVDPLRLGDAPAEGRLFREEAVPAGPHSHDCRNQRGVQHMIDIAGTAELHGQRGVQRAQGRSAARTRRLKMTVFGAVAHAPLAVMLIADEMMNRCGVLAPDPAMVTIGVACVVVSDETSYRSQQATRANSPAHCQRLGVWPCAAFPSPGALTLY